MLIVIIYSQQFTDNAKSLSNDIKRKMGQMLV